MDFPKDTMVGVGISREAGEAWPVFRLSQMRDPHDEREVETWRRLFEAAPGLLAFVKKVRQMAEFGERLGAHEFYEADVLMRKATGSCIARAEGGAA